jgi:hypothetical protein
MFPESILDRRHDAEELETAWRDIDCMPVRPKWQAMDRDEFEIVSEAARFIEDVLQNGVGSVSDWESTGKIAALEKLA